MEKNQCHTMFCATSKWDEKLLKRLVKSHPNLPQGQLMNVQLNAVFRNFGSEMEALKLKIFEEILPFTVIN